MSPELLAEYLKVLRTAGVMQAGLEIPLVYDGEIHVTKLNVLMSPEGVPPETLTTPVVRTEPTPGGWKGGTTNLDESMNDESIPL